MRKASILLRVRDVARPLLAGTDIRSQLIRGASGTLLLKIFDAAMALLTTLVLARILGLRNYGIYAYTLSWVVLLSMPAVLGLPRLLIREVAAYRARQQFSDMAEIVRWSDRVVLLASTGIALVAAAVVWSLSGRVIDEEFVVPLWISLAMLPLFTLMRVRQGATQGAGGVVAGQISQMVVLPIVLLVLVIVFHWIAPLEATGSVVARTLAMGAALVAGSHVRRRFISVSGRDGSTGDKRRWLRSGMTFLMIDVGAVANEQLSLVVLGTLAGPEAAGIFDVARRASLLLRLIFQVVDSPLAPAVAKLYAQGESGRLERIASKAAQVGFLASLPVALAMVVLATPILRLFGSGFQEGGSALAILVVGQLVNAYVGTVAILLTMTGREKLTAQGVGIAAVVNLVLSVLLARRMGAEGGAIANATSTILWNVLLYRSVRTHLGIRVTALSSSSWAKSGKRSSVSRSE